MPIKISSLILLFVSLILSAIMIRAESLWILLCLAANLGLLFATRAVSKIENDYPVLRNSSATIFMILASLLLTAVIIEPAFTSLLVIILNAVVLMGMRHMAKVEAFEAHEITHQGHHHE